MSPVDQIRFERDLANKREYTPEEAKENIADTLLGLAYSTPGIANSMSIRDAFEAKEAAAAADDPEEKKRLNAQAVVSALSAFLPFSIGSPAAGASARFGVFAGPSAKTADHAALARAKDMAKAGASRDEILTETGWSQQHGQWKFEIDDSTMEAALPPAGSPASRDITKHIKHPALYEAYPQLKDIDFRLDPQGKAGSGAFSGAFDSHIPPSIRIAPGSPAQTRSVAAHELDHAVQNIEGFPRGASASEYARGPMFSKRARDLQGDLSKELTGGLSARPDQIIKDLKYGDPKAFDEIAKKHGFKHIYEAVRFLAREDELRTPFGQYRRTAGEVAASNTGGPRLNMTAAERRERGYWETQDVPDNEQILRFYGDGPQEAFVPADDARAEIARSLMEDLPRSFTRPDKANREAFRQTGVLFGPEGAPRDVIPDDAMRIINSLQGGETRPLSSVVEHPELFGRVEGMADIPVEVLPAIPAKSGQGFHRPIARTTPEGGFQVSENARPRWLKEQLAKLMQYEIGNRSGFAAAGRHDVAGNIQKIDDTVSAVNKGMESGQIPAETGLAYIDKLTKAKGRIMLAEEAARTDPNMSPWISELAKGGRFERSTPERAVSKALNLRMAGNVDAELARLRLSTPPAKYPYEGRSLGEMIVLPQQTDDMGQLAEFLRNWRTYGAGARQPR